MDTFSRYLDEEMQKYKRYEEELAFQRAIQSAKITLWKTVLLVGSNEHKQRLENALGKCDSVLILASPAIPEGEIYEMTDKSAINQYVAAMQKWN